MFYPPTHIRTKALGQLTNGQKRTVVEVAEDIGLKPSAWWQRSRILDYFQSLERRGILDSERVYDGNGVRRYFVRDTAGFSKLLTELLN